ncbi:MAG: hypothetical protein HZA78_04405 [Candidatus Schekmanbacteria bacterium]|nr:hypothetical protein [Candidatus Schekmanbacteria bacterium]
MKIKSYEFSLRELSGSLGDFGTLFPLALGYINICGLNPAGLLIMMGLANIVTGLIYQLPMPIEPMKVLAIMAIASHWKPSLVYASAFGMGIIWLFIAVTGIGDWIAKITSAPVVRGIQISLGILLMLEAIKLIADSRLLGLLSIFIILTLRNNKHLPAAIVLVLLGLFIMLIKGDLTRVGWGFNLPGLTAFTAGEVWLALKTGGLAQIPLTATNAVIATAALISAYWPDKAVGEKKLALNMGIMNLIVPFFGGMPMCHGAGGLAGQYYFGARTGGANILEGLIEISLGLFFAPFLVKLFSAFPGSIFGAMLLLVGFELVKTVKSVWQAKEIIPAGVTVLVSLFWNMAWGFLVGLVFYWLVYPNLFDRIRLKC